MTTPLQAHYQDALAETLEATVVTYLLPLLEAERDAEDEAETGEREAA